jgi:hypothetical protein
LGVHRVVSTTQTELSVAANVTVEYETSPPTYPTNIAVLRCTDLAIPPGVERYEHSCWWRVATTDGQPGTLHFFRNHAHRAATDLWSELHSPRAAQRSGDGPTTVATVVVGHRSPKMPQTMVDEEHTVMNGTLVRLVCVYNTSTRSNVTYFGLDESKQEMCLQYYGTNDTVSVERV